jgi:hypothetical protein
MAQYRTAAVMAAVGRAHFEACNYGKAIQVTVRAMLFQLIRVGPHGAGRLIRTA